MTEKVVKNQMWESVIRKTSQEINVLTSPLKKSVVEQENEIPSAKAEQVDTTSLNFMDSVASGHIPWALISPWCA